jgi:hypothetical protein
MEHFSKHATRLTPHSVNTIFITVTMAYWEINMNDALCMSAIMMLSVDIGIYVVNKSMDTR